jgi:hypothetical protein
MWRHLALGLVCAVVAACSSSSHAPAAAGDAAIDAEPDRAGDAVSDAARGDADARRDADASSDAPDGAPAAFCGLATSSLVPDTGSIADVLSGSSLTPSVSCASTPEPDAFYTLDVSTFTIVDLRVDAPIAMVIAVRAGCGPDAVEVACGSSSVTSDDGPTPGPTESDASADAATIQRTSSLRVGLSPGRYTVIVDSLAPDQPATAFTISATTVAPAANVTCAAAATLDSLAPTVHGDLDLAGAPAADCGGATSRALLYAVEVPSGQHLVARATTTGGDRDWTPRLTAFEGCAATTCLAQGADAAGAEQRLDWINNGAATRLVILSVAADGPVVGGQFDLGAGLTDLLATCARPTPVVDGTTLVNLDFADVATSTTATCAKVAQPALYFVATLRPQQELSVEPVLGSLTIPIDVGFRSACDDDCETTTFPAHMINETSQPEMVLIEVTAMTTTATGPFALAFSLPPPPAGIVVTPTSPLVTTEAGGQATFQVALATEPTASVTVALSSSRPSEGTVSPPSLVFDATDWDQPQTVTITGVEDDVGDGTQTYTIVTAPAVSADPSYAGLDADDLPLTNLDDDPSLVLTGTDDVVTSEDGTSATFTVRLDVAPTSAVTVPLSSADLGEGTVSPPSLTFTPASWSVPQAVTVTGVDDGVVDGPQRYAIDLGPLASEDARYAGLVPVSVVAFNRDNDFGAVVGTVVSGTASCTITGALNESQFAGTPNQFPLAVDALGAVYAVALCDGALALFTSPDGGKTITGPIPVPGATDIVGAFAVAADRGRAWVAFEDRRGLHLTRTADAGRTWSGLRTITSDAPDLLRLAAARDTVVITGTDAASPSGAGSLVFVSQDGGLSFARQPDVAGQMTALALSSDGAAMWLVDDVPNLLHSLDGGATFTLEGVTRGAPIHCCYLAGTHDLYFIQQEEVTLTNLADGANDGAFAGTAGPAVAAAIDDTNVVWIFSNGVYGLEASRFDTDDNLGAVMAAGTAASITGAVMLARHATAIASVIGGNLLLTTAIWP